MLSKNEIKRIQSLKQKKFRQEYQLFVAEGIKTITELLDSSFELHQLYATDSCNFNANKQSVVTEAELKKISFLKTPNKALAVFKIPATKTVDFNNLVLALDDVRDPGNLGTIIRLCDWFGIQNLVCSHPRASPAFREHLRAVCPTNAVPPRAVHWESLRPFQWNWHNPWQPSAGLRPAPHPGQTRRHHGSPWQSPQRCAPTS